MFINSPTNVTSIQAIQDKARQISGTEVFLPTSIESRNYDNYTQILNESNASRNLEIDETDMRLKNKTGYINDVASNYTTF